MARFSADGQDYTRALALGSQTAFTVCCWVNIVDNNNYSTLWSLDNGTGDMELLQTDVDGTTLMFYPDYDAGDVVALTPGAWTFVAIAGASTGNTRTAYYRTAGQTSLTSVALGAATATNMATLRIGESAFGGEWLNGRISGLKGYIGATLTADEILLESMRHVPARLANLAFWHPFIRAETTDYSGNGRTLSGGSGTSIEDGPPIPWQGTSPRIILPASASGATAAAQVASATASAQDATTAVATSAQEAAASAAAQAATGLAAVVAVATEAPATAAAQNPAGLTAVVAVATEASATGAAQDAAATTAVVAAAEVAPANGTAETPTGLVSASADVATGSAAAQDSTVAVVASPAEATATAQALDATAITGSAATAAAESASATAAALDPTVAAGASAGEASATAVANDPTDAVAVSAGVAIASAAALDPNPAVLATPGDASATAAALDATALASSGSTAAAQVATATAVALDAVALVVAQALEAAATAAALDAGGLTAVVANAQVAAATGAALDATVRIVANPTEASATASAINATGVVQEDGLPDGGVVLRVREITAQLESYVAALGVVESINGGELRHMIGNGLRAGLWFDRVEPLGEASGLSSITVRLEMKIRIYGNLQREPSDEIEPEMLTAVDAVMNAFAEGYTIEGEVRDVDMYGTHGQRFSAQAGYLDLQEGTCRVETITVPLIVNDVWQLVA